MMNMKFLKDSVNKTDMYAFLNKVNLINELIYKNVILLPPNTDAGVSTAFFFKHKCKLLCRIIFKFTDKNLQLQLKIEKVTISVMRRLHYSMS